MSVVEYERQMNFIERVFYSLFCKLVKMNYCGYPLNLDRISRKIDGLREEFIKLEMEYALNVFSTEENFKMFLIEETHFKNKGYYNEEENKVFLLFSEEEILNNEEENQDIELLVNNLYKILTIEKIKSKKLTMAS